MFCRSCGKQLPPGATVCPYCGVPAGIGRLYCPNCGNATLPQAVVCVKCGCNLVQPGYGQGVPNPAAIQKSKIAAGLLGIFLGGLGIHNFYLGFTGKATTQLILGLLSLVTCGITGIVSAIWGLVEGIAPFTSSYATDANGIPLA